MTRALFALVAILALAGCTAATTAPAAPAVAPVGIGATVAAAEGAMQAAATAQAVIVAATAEAVATESALSVQATQQALSYQATQQALELAIAQDAATQTVAASATAQALMFEATAAAVQAQQMQAQASATAQAAATVLRTDNQRAYQQMQHLVILLACVLPSGIVGIVGAIGVINRGLEWLDARREADMAHQQALAVIEEHRQQALVEAEKRKVVAMLVQNTIRTQHGYYVWNGEEFVFLPSQPTAQLVEQNPRHQAAFNVMGKPAGVIDLDGRPEPTSGATDLTPDEKDMISMLEASTKMLGGHHPYIAGSRAMTGRWRRRNGRRQQLVNALKTMGLVETTEGRVPEGRLSNIWLREDSDYQNIDDLLDALRCGALRVPDNVIENVPEWSIQSESEQSEQSERSIIIIGG